MPFFLLVKQRIEKDVVWKLRERERARRELQARSYLAIRCRRSIKIRKHNRGTHVLWLDPAARGSLRKPCLDLHSIRQKFLHVRRGRTEQRGALAVFNEINVEDVKAGRRVIGRLIDQLGEAAVGQTNFPGLDRVIPRVYHFGFNRKASELPIPVALLHDDADMNVIAGSVNTSLGEHERVQVFW